MKAKEVTVDDNVRYNCGCGYTTSITGEAYAHVNATGHTMDAHGTIVPLNKIK
jgi:hypothetical protein